METVDVDDIICVIKNEKDLVSNWERFLNNLHLKQIGEKEKTEFKAAFEQSRDQSTLLSQILSKWIEENRKGTTVKNLGEVLKRSGHSTLKHKLTTTFQPENVIVVSENQLLQKSECPEKLLQIVNWSQGGGKEECYLYLPNLLSLLTQIGSRPVTIISINGSPSPPKSMLTDQIIKYFKFGCKGDAAWSQKQIENGFQSNADDFKRATGMRIWNEPFYIQKNDKEIGVIVMEVHEKFETLDFKKDPITTALSLLISSITYFVANDVKQPVEWFKKYLSANEPKEYPKRLFQNLMIFCHQQGKEFQPSQLKAKLLDEALKELPTSLEKYFEEVKCEALPAFAYSGWSSSMIKFIEKEFSPENIGNSTKHLYGAELAGNNLKEFACLWAHLATTSKEKIRPKTILYQTGEIFGSVFSEELLNKYRKFLGSLKDRNIPELETKFDELHTDKENELINELMSTPLSKSIKDNCKDALSLKIDALKYNFASSSTIVSKPKEITTSYIGKITYDESAELGRGANETVVYRGKFGDRNVAVKRLNRVHYDLEKEVRWLIQSDKHINVIRYFDLELHDNFILIALELCDMSLETWVQDKSKRQLIQISTREILMQSAEGLGSLHEKKIIHRDIKPGNILLTVDTNKAYVKISDFGLCKQLLEGTTSLSCTSQSGTPGWLAPEVLRFAEKNHKGDASTKMSYKTDIFSLGCVFYYVLTEGKHPFGDSVRRQVNILDKKVDVNADVLKRFGCSGAEWLIKSMVLDTKKDRPTASAVIKHHYLWSPDKASNFLVAINKCKEVKGYTEIIDAKNYLDKWKGLVFNLQDEWGKQLDAPLLEYFKEELSKSKFKANNYDYKRVDEMIRMVRNIEMHQAEKKLPQHVMVLLGLPDKYVVEYFTDKFPLLVPITWLAFQKLKTKPEFKLQEYYPDDYEFRQDLLKPLPKVSKSNC